MQNVQNGLMETIAQPSVGVTEPTVCHVMRTLGNVRVKQAILETTVTV
jgi:spore maturation protein SpmB